MRTFYRIAKTSPPTVEDFRSNTAKGRPMPIGLPRKLRPLWDGISVYDDEARSIELVRASPMIGSFIAELTIPDDAGFRIEQTTRDDRHHTIWGRPEELLQCVTRVRPVLRPLP